ncbi:MAG: UTP--glucose-1-phosphate uridylyltransferase [Holosporaceae bacterium]|nr:UTP--glucose-1-phosphate uridylyltransferase [Holosporaceae bacterium]
MKIRKVVFPVGGLGTRFYPITRAIPKEMLCVIDKPLIHYAFEEALAAGIEQFIFVTRQGKNSIEDYFDYLVTHSADLNTSSCSFCYVRQNEPRGLGHAVLCAQHLVNDEPFAVISADDYISHKKSCIGEMIQNYNGANMSAVMTVPRKDVSKYGIMDVGTETDKIVMARSVDEKPSLEHAKSNLAIVGRYVLNHEIFGILKNLKPGVKNEIQLTDALLQMIPTHGLMGFKFEGKRFDCGSREGLLSAILHASNGDKRLAGIVRKFCEDI